MRTILIVIIVSLVDFRTRIVCNCFVNSPACPTSCLSCIAQLKGPDDGLQRRPKHNRDLKKPKIAVQCPTCDISECNDYVHNLDFGIDENVLKQDEVKLRTKRNIIRVPKKRKEQKCPKSKRLINSSCKAIYH